MNDVIVKPDALRTLAAQLDEVKSALDQAHSNVESAELSGGVFSKLGLGMKAVYPTGQRFAAHDAEEQGGQIESIQERLRATADLWDQTEECSTVEVVEI